MSTYRNTKISKIKLKNASGTSCSLECYYKMAQDDKPKRIGSTGHFPLGQSKTLDLKKLKDLPEGAWVTAYSNVAGDDSQGNVWFIYGKDVETTASFEISGTAFKTKTSFTSISEMYGEELVNKLKLNNQSGTVCSLECYYKKNKEDDPNRMGSTGNFPVGQSKTLNLDTLELPDSVWVTAYVNVDSGSDDHSNVWFQYKKGNNKCAEYTITGVINFTTVGFDQVESVK